MISFNLEARNWDIDTQEVLRDGELHLGASLDDLVEGEGGGDGDGGSSVELQRVRHHAQLVYGERLGGAL